MSNSMNKIGKYTDLIAAGVVVLVVVMMIIPLPAVLLDLLITLNISCALAIVVTTMYVQKALDFSVFPTLLLITTLFRLAINVSVTRLILLHGDAGHVVSAFGNFVVGGNVVVGLVVFLILIVIQFVVVTNGAGRVAEVGARFTLDAMPGKQMAIDADLKAAQIPALLISVATGIIVTRSASEKDLGSDLASQVLKQRKAPLVAGGVICAFALVPGLPKLPFLIIGGLLFAVGRALKDVIEEREREAAAAAALPEKAAEPSSRDQAVEALTIDPLELAIGFG